MSGSLKLYSVKETCQILGVCRHTLRKLEEQGKLVPIRVGRRVLYRRSDIERFIAETAKAA